MKSLSEMINASPAESYRAAMWWGHHTARCLHARHRRQHIGSVNVSLALLQGRLAEWRKTPLSGDLSMSYVALMDPKPERYPLLSGVELFNTASRRAFLQGFELATVIAEQRGLVGLNRWLIETAGSIGLIYLKTKREAMATRLRVGRACRVLKGRYYRHMQVIFDCWQMNTYSCYNLMERCQVRDCSEMPTLRIALNCHGVVSEYDVCAKHGAGRHGNWADSL